jgi:tetratricopeptide (TPR) repeat protein
MPRSACWYKAVMVSLLLHGLLLVGGGLIAMSHMAAPEEEQYTEMELGSDVAEIEEPNMPIEPEATAADDMQKKEATQEPQQQTGKTRSDIPPGPSPAKVSGKDIPEQMLSHYTKEQLNLALAQYNQALTMNPQAAFALSNRGQVYYDKGELDKALTDFTQALTINPRLASSHIGRGFIFIKKKQWDLAMEDFDQAVLIAPQDALAYYGRALCFSKNGDKQKAANDFRSFIQYAKPEHEHLVKKARQILAGLGEP